MSSFRPALSGLLSLLLLASACAQPTAAPTPAATAAPDPRSATVGDFSGSVNGRPSPVDALAPVAVGFQLRTGGEVQTGEASRARLDFSDGAILRLASNSSFVLQSATPVEAGDIFARVRLSFGKLWVSLFGGELQVETPVGVAAVRGSFAVFSYQPGDPDNPDDDLLVVDCLEGSCSASNEAVDEQLGNLERVVLGRTASLRQILTEADVQQFLADNPESQRLVATLTAAPAATATLTPALATATPTASLAPSETPTATATPTTGGSGTGTDAAPGTPGTPAATTPGAAGDSLGTHVVRAGETLFCIGRGYGVLPNAIAAANNFAPADALRLGQNLIIPAVPWTDISPGPVCPPQFRSPFPGLPTATVTPPPTATATSTSGPACGPNEFFDPVMQQCRPLTPPPTDTLVPTATNTLPPPTATPDTFGPTITGLTVTPSQAGATFGCSVTFSATLSDPVGVSSATVYWTATNTASQVTSGSVPMAVSGSTGVATWVVSFSPSFPYYGTVTWSVLAVDGLGNQSTAGAATPLTVNSPGCI